MNRGENGSGKGQLGVCMLCCKPECSAVALGRSLYELSQGCLRHSAAVALFSGISSSIGSKKSVKAAASSWDHSYFSTKTSKRPQGFSLVMCFRSPESQDKEVSLQPCYGHDLQNMPSS